jgi:hypothetical protein
MSGSTAGSLTFSRTEAKMSKVKGKLFSNEELYYLRENAQSIMERALGRMGEIDARDGLEILWDRFGQHCTQEAGRDTEVLDFLCYFFARTAGSWINEGELDNPPQALGGYLMDPSDYRLNLLQWSFWKHFDEYGGNLASESTREARLTRGEPPSGA